MIKNHYNLAIALVFATVFGLGITISILVYLRTEAITDATLILVEEQLPHYDTIQQFHQALTEQERYLYEYYATQGSNYYSVGFSVSEQEAQESLQNLKNLFEASDELLAAEQKLAEIKHLAQQFHLNMSEGPDWDLAREQLADISQARRAILPFTNTLRTKLAQEVKASQHSVANRSDQVNHYVVVHFVLMLLISLVVVRAIRSAIKSSATSRRLALFPKRNPNPVISLDTALNMSFSNPATDKLLDKLNLNKQDLNEQLAAQIEQHQDTIQNSRGTFSRFEYELENRYLRCEIHWQSDIQQWDVHMTDITAQKQAEKDLTWQASHHPETGLCNQYALKEKISAHASGDEFTIPFSMTLMALADYDALQISKGLDNAQLVINQLASTIAKVTQETFGNQAQVFQISDNSFVVLHANAADLTEAKALVTALDSYLAHSLFHYQYQPRLHYGLTQYPRFGRDLPSLLRTARHALENVSVESEHFCSVYDKSMGEQIGRELRLMEDIKTGIHKDEFQLHFQPQVDILTKQIIGAEVLIRWPRPDGWVSPGEFIPLAERSGLIIPIGNWILRSACQQAKHLIDAGFDELVMAVNISPKQFTRNDFLTTVCDILKETGLPAKNLELEITEGVIMHNEEQTIETLNQLKSLGIMLAIDDFGTGYSSLSYLKRFPIDKLKIDQSFVRDMHTNSSDEAIVRTVVDLGKNLGLKLIAEGVEQQSQWDLLAQQGCDEIQGYLFSRPLPLTQYQQFLQERAKTRQLA